MRTYCSENDVQNYLAENIIVEGTNPLPDPYNPSPETLPLININFYIQQASQIVDSMLCTIYYVPLKKINYNGTINYPYPINLITTILSAEMIYMQRLMGADRQISEPMKMRFQVAREMLAQIQNGEIRLTAQRSARSHRFIRGTLWGIPKNPTEGGRTKIDQGV